MIYLCDFEDSFTYNIYADLKLLGLKVEVIEYKNIFSFLQDKINSNIDKNEIIILGPGPGHPSNYEFLIPSIQSLFNKSSLLLVGICLGHQLIWQALGYNCTHSSNPVHGQSEVLNPDKYWSIKFGAKQSIMVQRYNSLCIKLTNAEVSMLVNKEAWHIISTNSEIVCSSRDGIITYQFHPESVGTSCPKCFYGPLQRFLLS